MKKTKLIILHLVVIAFGIMIACNNDETSNGDTTPIIENIDNNDGETDTDIETRDVKSEDDADKVSKYICPVGCKDGNSNKKGNCPSCKMELIENIK